jgi:hypothetical protein
VGHKPTCKKFIMEEAVRTNNAISKCFVLDPIKIVYLEILLLLSTQCTPIRLDSTHTKEEEPVAGISEGHPLDAGQHGQAGSSRIDW